MDNNWRTALFEQALSDYRMMIRLIHTDSVEDCHRLHYLLMASEKIAKAFTSNGANPPELKHEALTKFLQMAHHIGALQQACDMTDTHKFIIYLRSLQSIAQRLEKLAPQGKEQLPNPEYPWEEREIGRQGDIHVHIRVPARHDFSLEWQNNAASIGKFMQFLDVCFKIAHRNLTDPRVVS